MVEPINIDDVPMIINSSRMVEFNRQGNPGSWTGIGKQSLDEIDRYHTRRSMICPYEVSLHDTPFVDKLMKDEVYSFIIEELSGKWFRTKAVVFCFELEADAMAFKLRWM